MKKFSCAFLLLTMIIISCAPCAFADENNVKVGVLSQLNMDEVRYRVFVVSQRETVGWHFLSHANEIYSYYDSLVELQLALNAGDIDEVQLPEAVGEYFVNTNPSAYAVCCVTSVNPTYLAFGFLADNKDLRDKFNTALTELKEEGVLEQLRLEYVVNFKDNMNKKVNFEKFDGAEKIIVALTGDLPPIDYVAADGRPAGFNMAIIAAIGKKLKLNIDVMDIAAGARSAALASGRADAAFWYKNTKDVEIQPDIPERIIISDAYYSWEKFIHVKKK